MAVDVGAGAPSPDPMASPPMRPARRSDMPSDVAVGARDLLPAGLWAAKIRNQKKNGIGDINKGRSPARFKAQLVSPPLFPPAFCLGSKLLFLLFLFFFFVLVG